MCATPLQTLDRLDFAFYPPAKPFVDDFLKLDHLHSMHYEEVGNPTGIPIVILHGGPGGGINPYYRQMVDPAFYRGILFDQRGCGQSKPFGELKDNTTQHLVDDIERLRKHLRIKKWFVLGGSWSSALTLAYAQAYPASCLGLIVTGVTLYRAEDTHWWWEGSRYVFPDVWDRFQQFLPAEERDELKKNYIKRVLNPDPKIHGPAAISMMTYEAQLLDPLPNQEFIESLCMNKNTLAMGRIFALYEKHNAFLGTTQLLDNIDKIKNIPGFIIQGRFDMCCPPQAAYDLHKAWPKSQFFLIPMSGHRWNDPFLGAAIVRATDAFKSF